jgi:hypothetical protein
MSTQEAAWLLAHMARGIGRLSIPLALADTKVIRELAAHGLIARGASEDLEQQIAEQGIVAYLLTKAGWAVVGQPQEAESCAGRDDDRPAAEQGGQAGDGSNSGASAT